MSKEVLIFGAGNIGRSFITPIFLDAGYTVYLADINTKLITSLKKAGQYNIRICSNEEETIRIVQGFHPVALSNKEALFPLLMRIPLMVTSVGLAGLEAVSKLIAETLSGRINNEKEYIPLDIILAENLRNASSFCHGKILESLSGSFPVESHLGLVETSIGKMVPLRTEQDIIQDSLGMKAEPYNTLILDKDGFIGPIPQSPCIQLVSPIKPWVDRKLFIHNLGHAAAAYLGRQYFPNETYLAPLMKDKDFVEEIRNVMTEGANILLSEYPEVFTIKDLTDHIDDLLTRFSNTSLGDTVQRVGRDLSRKLSGNDRIVGAMAEAVQRNLPIKNICRVYLAALSFEQVNQDSEDYKIFTIYKEEGLEAVYTDKSCVGDFSPAVYKKILDELKRIEAH
ncbi:mannitol-1-phosphate 5-dehydrogenase [Oceanispirochaeta crateris]|uniref:Mannitol-1-phosphate 5-dehydrogenase n=1 Tax=Oceanispirochaeta crateris TaxID=2518645 RepID=A0A5C1QP54_9SPIO|nr:mannitol-1-phosphate 5-dehydrogenase [Oceanispirochaeta crateris]QEN08344.1 mannitol-1-phosphate 5-dehydrogenase [Oceanispirochaeta crateris]